MKNQRCGEYRLNIGCGRINNDSYIGIDIEQCIGDNGKEMVDIVMDIEKNGLPFCDNSCIEIKADSVLEHINNLEFVLNECWRVLKKDGFISGCVPMAGTDGSFRDPTHKRFFTKSTFDYFCGEAEWNKELPSHPRYARYGFLPWVKIYLEGEGSLNFKMSPRK